MKKVLIASDHAGLPLKSFLVEKLKTDFEFLDLGTHDEKSVDYPDFAAKLCEALLAKKADTGILVCGSGQGMAMKANHYKGVRAALCWNLASAQLSRQHNDANVLCLGSRLIPFDEALEITRAWIATPFEGGRHQMRVAKIDQS